MIDASPFFLTKFLLSTGKCWFDALTRVLDMMAGELEKSSWRLQNINVQLEGRKWVKY